LTQEFSSRKVFGMEAKEALKNEKESVAVALGNAWENIMKKLEEWQDHTQPFDYDRADHDRNNYENGLRTGTIYGLMIAMDLIEIEKSREDMIYSAQLREVESESPLPNINL